jgi:predicted NAD-dependent protein-ADP-ribosyltransferase YbiA (DUF1768 family)
MTKQQTVFSLANNAKDLPLFKRSGEHLGTDDTMDDYEELKDVAKVAKESGGWRKVLSSFWKIPGHGMLYNGYYYATQEHAFQAAKFWEDNRDYALDTFSIPSNENENTNTNYIRDPTEAKKRGEKTTVDYLDNEGNRKKVKIDEILRLDQDESKQVKSELLTSVLRQKFLCNHGAKEILLATGNAILNGRGGKALQELMFVRADFQKDQFIITEPILAQ